MSLPKPVSSLFHRFVVKNSSRKARASSAVKLLIAFALASAVGASVAQAQRPIGVDVSSYQGSSVNWTSVKGDGVAFAWAKATEGDGVNDSTFVGNVTRGKSAGVIMGAYHFAHPNLNSPATEANHFWSIAGPYILADNKTLMPMLDMEVFSGLVGASSYTQWANNWCADIVAKAAAAGVKIKPVIYVSACNACYFNSGISQWYSDIADYNGGNIYTGTPWTTCTSCEVWGSGVWHFWQVSSTASISGISGNVDLDGYNGTLAGLQSTMVATVANSPIYYWDPQGTSGANPYTGNMTGNWEDKKWSVSSAGQATQTNWVDGKAACFGVHTGVGTPAYTVTMNSSHVVAGFFNGALTPNACTVTVNGPGTITLASGAQGFDSFNSSDGASASMTFNTEIAGDGQAVPEGNGQLYFHGTNTYSGGTQLGYFGNAFTGILNFNNDSAFGSGEITTSNGYGCALVLEGSLPVTIANPFTAIVATNKVNIVGNPAGLTFTGSWQLNGSLQIGSGGSANNLVTIAGPISGSGAYFSKYNPGMLALSGTNSYTGPTAIAGGPLLITGSGNLGNGAYSARITNGSTFVYASTYSQTLSGVISGAGSVVVSNTGLLTMIAANTYAGGTTVGGGGTLAVTADSVLGAAAGAITLNGGCLKNNNSVPTITASRTLTLGSDGGFFDAGWGPSSPLTIASKITGTGDLAVNLDGSPVVLSNAGNDYTGDTIVGTNGPGYYAAGTKAWLKLGASGVIPTGAGKGDVIVNQAYAGVLDLAGFTQTVNGLFGNGLVDNSGGSGVLTVGNNDRSSLFAGVIQNSAGTLALTKIGSGIFTLTGANTYAGNTLVSAGTLALGGGSIAGNVSVSASATLANATTNGAIIGGTATLTPGAFASFAASGGIPAALGKFSIAGDLILNGNVLIIDVSGAALPAGSYRLLECAGALSGLANVTPTLTGIPLPAGYTAAVSTTTGIGGHVDLVIKADTVIANVPGSQAIVYGAATVALTGSVSGAGSAYPALGELVAVTINGNTQTTAINDATGDFTINYNLAALPASAVPYTISYAYAGDAALNGANNAATTLTVNQRAAMLSGTRAYDGTTDAAAAILSITNVVGGDVVTLTSGSAVLADSAVGAQAIVSAGTLALGGLSATNYTLIGATGSVIITQPSFPITGEYIDASGTNFVITWQATPGLTYQVLGATNVTTAVSNWVNIGDPVIATNASTSMVIPMTGMPGFFKARQK